MVIDGMLSTGHARALISIEDQELQYQIAQRVFDEKLSVREVEKLVKNLGKEKKDKKQERDEALEVIYRSLEERMKQTLGTKVAISSKGKKGGKVEIEFYNNDDLEKIVDRLS